MRISSITKNAGKACNNRLYRHIRTFEKIIKNYFVILLKKDDYLIESCLFSKSDDVQWMAVNGFAFYDLHLL